MKLGPKWQRRLDRLRSHRRGWGSLWLFSILFVACLSAEFVANDRPLLVKYDGHFYFPSLATYPETTFGGEFATEADYRDSFVIGKIHEHGWMLMPLIPYSYQTVNFAVVPPSPPSLDNPLGTDDQGRDVMARFIYGFRISMLFGLVLTALSSVIGIALGAIQGYFGGVLDLILQRLIEIWANMPVLFIIIIMSSFIVPTFWSLLAILLLFSWMTLVPLVRAEFYRTRNFDYVRAARALGVSDVAIMTRHILPNATVATMTFLPFILTGSLTTLTSLDLLGFGLPPGSPSLGEMIAQGKNHLDAPWLGLTAFLSISTVLVMLTFIGEAMRDSLDPRRAGRLPVNQGTQPV